VVYVIVMLSFVVSTVLSIQTLKRSNKMYSLFIALSANTLIILLGTLLIFEYDEVARIFGFYSHSLTLIISIPTLTWLNYMILMLVESRSMDKTI
jgi:fumarate reductase subunit C